MPQKSVDIVIIGGGVIGCSIAYQLAKYEISVLLIEREADVCFGSSGANTGLIHSGFNPIPGSLKARFNYEGNELYTTLARNLDVPFKRIGALVVAKSNAELSSLDVLIDRGQQNNVKDLRLVTQAELRSLEPAIDHRYIGALYAPTAGIISPYELTIALVENAVENGVSILFENTVKNIIVKHGIVTSVVTDKWKINTRYVINSAGLYSDKIAEMAGVQSFKISPRRGEYLLLDPRRSGLVTHTIFPVPDKVSKGIVVTPTVEGNILLGPNAVNITDKADNSTSACGLAEILSGAKKLVPTIEKIDIITSFAGNRAVSTKDDFIIGPTEIDGFINVAGIASPGLSAAPAIAKHVVDLIIDNSSDKVLKDKFKLKPKSIYRGGRIAPKRITKISYSDLDRIIKKNPNYGNVVCRCERVTEGEVVETLRRPVQVTTLKGVKYRTRAGMGRCQGGFCIPKLIFILSHELGLRPEQVSLIGQGSEQLTPTKKSKNTIKKPL